MMIPTDRQINKFIRNLVITIVVIAAALVVLGIVIGAT